MAENLTDYYAGVDVRVRYLHSDIHTLERVEIIRDLRLGEFDVLVGVNLLREGLDIPEVSLVAILDADKEGFLRSERSLIQTSGRAARNINGKVIMYADKITKSIQACLDETKRRRIIQQKYNEENNITPETVKIATLKDEDLPALIAKLTKEMKQAAKNMEFERAAELRDELKELNKIMLEMG